MRRYKVLACMMLAALGIATSSFAQMRMMNYQPIVSPEFRGGDAIFRFKADEAESVKFESELFAEPLAMEKDADGLWTIKIGNGALTTFKYCFVVDGMKVADPMNMYLSPDKGFKYSVSMAMQPDMDKIEHGIVEYDYAHGKAWYCPPSAAVNSLPEAADQREVITLIPGKDDTLESWFKVGRVDDIADRLIASGAVKPCFFFVANEPARKGSRVLRADDFSTWRDRSEAFESLLKGEKVTPLINSLNFRTTIDGKKTDLYTISKGNITAQITNYGGFIVSLVSPDKDGNMANIVTHYDKVLDYRSYNLGMVGPALGRFANRIANARFTLDKKEYTLTKNNGENILHSGKNGFDHTVWDVVKHDASTLVLSCISPDGTDGFPGTLTTTLTYSITSDGGLSIKYEATTDKPTVVNLSNHAYFNLNGAGSGDIMDHQLTINADAITEAGRDGIPSGKFLNVKGTPYDFTQPCRIGDRQMSMQGFRWGQKIEIPEGKVMNYDNNFCLNHSSKGIEKVATLHSPLSGRTLEVWNDHPGLQVYTGARTAIALESQMYPDSPNHPEFPSTILRPGQTYTHTCIYKVK